MNRIWHKRIDEKCVKAIADIQKQVLIKDNIMITCAEASQILAEIYFNPNRPLFNYDHIPFIRHRYRVRKNMMRLNTL